MHLTAKLYEKVANQRRNFDAIVIEDLPMKGVLLVLHSGKQVADNDWRLFMIFLKKYLVTEIFKQKKSEKLMK
jgi:hypothetical protein